VTGIEPEVAGLLVALRARAAGFWRREGAALALGAFVPAPDLAPEVAEAFAAATRWVPLDRAELGIVRAVATAVPAVSIAADAPADAGSGKWLRAFGARCSVAVPLTDDSGAVVAVLSVALPERPAEVGAVTERIRQVGATCVDPEIAG